MYGRTHPEQQVVLIHGQGVPGRVGHVVRRHRLNGPPGADHQHDAAGRRQHVAPGDPPKADEVEGKCPRERKRGKDHNALAQYGEPEGDAGRQAPTHRASGLEPLAPCQQPQRQERQGRRLAVQGPSQVDRTETHGHDRQAGRGRGRSPNRLHQRVHGQAQDDVIGRHDQPRRLQADAKHPERARNRHDDGRAHRVVGVEDPEALVRIARGVQAVDGQVARNLQVVYLVGSGPGVRVQTRQNQGSRKGQRRDKDGHVETPRVEWFGRFGNRVRELLPESPQPPAARQRHAGEHGAFEEQSNREAPALAQALQKVKHDQEPRGRRREGRAHQHRRQQGRGEEPRPITPRRFPVSKEMVLEGMVLHAGPSAGGVLKTKAAVALRRPSIAVRRDLDKWHSPVRCDILCAAP